MKESKKKAYEIREDFKKIMNGEKTIPNYSEEEAETLEGWIGMFVANLSKAAENALNKRKEQRTC